MIRYFFFFWIPFFTHYSNAQSLFWEKARNPYGGTFEIAYTNTSKMFAWNSEEVFSSNDLGYNWDNVYVSEIDTLDFENERLSIFTSGIFYKILSYNENNEITYNLYSSIDEGQSWNLIDEERNFVKIFELPSGTLLGISQPWNSDLYRSTDQGNTWEKVFTPNLSLILDQYNSYISATDDGRALITALYTQKIILTLDDGITWVELVVPSVYNKHFLGKSGVIFSMDKFGNMQQYYRSINNGATWQLLSINVSNQERFLDMAETTDNKLLLLTTEKTYESIDNGETWTSLTVQPIQISSFAIQSPISNGNLLGYSRGALHRSVDNGLNWTFSSYGMTKATINALKAINEDTQLALTSTGLWSTINKGQNWSWLLEDTTNIFLYSEDPLAVISPDSFAVSIGNTIWTTLDGGITFTQITPIGGIVAGNIYVTSDHWLLCSSSEGILMKHQFNGNWELTMPGVTLIKFIEHKPTGKWFILTNPGHFPSNQNMFWTSSDKGLNWSLLPTIDWTTETKYELQIDQQNFIYLSGFVDNAMRIAISENGGDTWTYQIIPYLNTSGELTTNSLGHLFTLVNGGIDQLIISVDKGVSWYSLPSTESTFLNFLETSGDGYLFVSDHVGLFLRSSKPTTSGAYIHATVNRDADLDCSTPDAQEPLKNWNITVSGEEDYYGTTNANGYCTFYLDTAVYTVTARTPQYLWWSLCDSVQTVEATQAMGSDTVPFVALPLAECPLMSVNVAAPMLRRCFNNTVYINYCNQGTEPADSAWVDVILDEYLSFISSAQPYDSLGNNVYRFYLGDVNSGDCGDFNLTVYVSCDSTVLGQTHCISAHIFPDTLCTPTPNWSGANIEASVVCQDTLVQFKLENTGQSPSSTLEYIIIEDDVVLFTGQKSYAPGESILLDYDANGSTWRIESMQEPGHPFSYLALAFEEGCGGFESLGFINQFPVNGTSPSLHQICVENIGSFDPNDKQGFPNGVGEDHNIRPGQELEYLIRFQNTGTDTAFTVMIRDTLSAFLDPASVRPGASSHPYTWSLSGEGVITFTFNNIYLPDSNINEPASHGFVQFRISQQPNLPLGSVIENDAAIYFDFNAPVITNTTWHTLYDGPVMLAINEPGHNRTQQSLEIWPNPVKDQTSVRLKEPSAGNKRVNLYNSTGQIMQSFHFTGQETKLKCPSLIPGQYWLQVTDVQGRTLGSSVLVKE